MTSLAVQASILTVVFVIFYLVLVRPQRLQLKRHRDMLAGLRPGVRIATVGGLVGTIVSIEHPDRLTLNVADGVTVTVLRRSVDALIDPVDAYPAAANHLAQQRAVA